MVLINDHAPTKDKTNKEKEELYSALENVMDTSLGDVKIVLGSLKNKESKKTISLRAKLASKLDFLKTRRSDDTMNMVSDKKSMDNRKTSEGLENCSNLSNIQKRE